MLVGLLGMKIKSMLFKRNNMLAINITNEMVNQASIEAKKRDPHIKHHFEVSHLSSNERDILGFLGEFACCDLLKINWKDNIRDNYLSIDEYDFEIKNLKVDVKTETVPFNYANKILDRNIADDELYGRRLIHKGQFPLLSKYDIVIFGLFIRDDLSKWYPIGYIESKVILEHYLPTFERPDGGRYPFPASPIPTSILKPIHDLME